MYINIFEKDATTTQSPEHRFKLSPATCATCRVVVGVVAGVVVGVVAWVVVGNNYPSSRSGWLSGSALATTAALPQRGLLSRIAIIHPKGQNNYRHNIMAAGGPPSPLLRGEGFSVTTSWPRADPRPLCRGEGAPVTTSWPRADPILSVKRGLPSQHHGRGRAPSPRFLSRTCPLLSATQWSGKDRAHDQDDTRTRVYKQFCIGIVDKH